MWRQYPDTLSVTNPSLQTENPLDLQKHYKNHFEHYPTIYLKMKSSIQR